MRALWTLGCVAFVALGCGSPSTEAKTPLAARVQRDAVAPCNKLRDVWMQREVYTDSGRVFAVGYADTTTEAQSRGQQAMTQWLGVRISSKSVDWLSSAAGRDETRYETSAETYASHSLSACKLERSCGTGEQVAALVSCAQGTGFERELASLGRELGPKLPKGTTLLLPGVNEDQFVTRLGELTLTTLRPALEESKGSDTRFASPASLRLTELREVLRSQRATHWLALDVRLVGTERMQVTATVRDAENDLEVAGAHASRTFDLAPELLALSDARGPLFAQRAGADLAALEGREGVVAVSLPSRLEEGKPTAFEVRVTEPGYVVAYVIDEGGALTRVVPSPLAPESRVEPLAPLRVPTAAAERAGYRLRPCVPAGKPLAREQLKVIWSKAPLDLPGQPSRETGGYVVLEPGASGSQRKLVAALEAARAKGASFATALATYVIEGSPEGARRCAAP
jgi:hypothetical protein